MKKKFVENFVGSFACHKFEYFNIISKELIKQNKWRSHLLWFHFWDSILQSFSFVKSLTCPPSDENKREFSVLLNFSVKLAFAENTLFRIFLFCAWFWRTHCDYILFASTCCIAEIIGWNHRFYLRIKLYDLHIWVVSSLTQSTPDSLNRTKTVTEKSSLSKALSKTCVNKRRARIHKK